MRKIEVSHVRSDQIILLATKDSPFQYCYPNVSKNLKEDFARIDQFGHNYGSDGVRGVGTGGGGKGAKAPPNFLDDIKSALFPQAKCPHLFLEIFSKMKF